METPRPSWSSAAKIGRKRMLNKIIKLAAAGLAFTLASAQAAHADYPARAVTVVVPFSAGGNNDTIARIAADHLSKELGQPVVIENGGGGGGSVGSKLVAGAEPDGDTLLRSGGRRVREAGIWPGGSRR